MERVEGPSVVSEPWVAGGEGRRRALDFDVGNPLSREQGGPIDRMRKRRLSPRPSYDDKCTMLLSKTCRAFGTKGCGQTSRRGEIADGGDAHKCTAAVASAQAANIRAYRYASVTPHGAVG